jgi:NAD-dependent DNA ligase
MSDVASTLEQIKGIGPATRTAVLDAYPTLDSIDKATLAELEAVNGVGPATAKAIKSAVAKAEKSTAGTRTKKAAKSASTKAKGSSKKAATAAKGNAKATGTATKKAAKDVSTASKKAATEIADAANDTVEGTVVELREAGAKVGDQADNTVQQVKAALTSIQNIISAALDAGKESLPEAQKQLKAARTSLGKLGPTVVEAIENARNSKKS